ncbi:hypothetical protein [Chitinilyticum piscinae]|uniref:Uncharacterized protein n=1 Tax=Chitinilyticum piscinae TaxID=2866724 RepID=A0A8J7FZF1_9NEIS|nr:hypothetical protein [Chitinilyticum piscinae]MBE9608513.1 hypothetical protein [Chitinilyticum piscinae]
MKWPSSGVLRDIGLLLGATTLLCLACNSAVLCEPLIVAAFVLTRKQVLRLRFCLPMLTVAYWAVLVTAYLVAELLGWFRADFPGMGGALLFAGLVLPLLGIGGLFGHLLAFFTTLREG